ncbi:hypothetical protein RSOLAG1IB_05256 [Rhizoctonia solani AG-1 IB]|uniref:Uncharacterized protein n=1 Tax=Thanatephorus cucumeris (strain AG1-IB / isolate 7/3/14) TaxID=1108050 RepID=A0A0B7G277_THACB|nr:hypothetical protein RSOLAG1IB_05256 [Rhizoctonia solani AG-1 IB]
MPEHQPRKEQTGDLAGPSGPSKSGSCMNTICSMQAMRRALTTTSICYCFEPSGARGPPPPPQYINSPILAALSCQRHRP